jgi:hypothetical protein
MAGSEANPFSDHAAVQDERQAVVEATLAVGRNATLTLGTDAVIVLGEIRPWTGRQDVLTVRQTKDFEAVAASIASIAFLIVSNTRAQSVGHG